MSVTGQLVPVILRTLKVISLLTEAEILAVYTCSLSNFRLPRDRYLYILSFMNIVIVIINSIPNLRSSHWLERLRLVKSKSGEGRGFFSPSCIMLGVLWYNWDLGLLINQRVWLCYIIEEVKGELSVQHFSFFHHFANNFLSQFSASFSILLCSTKF